MKVEIELDEVHAKMYEKVKEKAPDAIQGLEDIYKESLYKTYSDIQKQSQINFEAEE